MTRHALLVMTACALAALPVAASAQDLGDCATDADCDDGFVCEVVGGSSCAAPGCAPGEECPPPPPCEPEEFRGCVPAPCATDDDCGGDLVCLEVGYTECSGGVGVPACAPGEDCPAPEPAGEPTCEEHVDRYCGPRYAAPCAADADCGEGFTCVAAEVCTCSAGTPTPVPEPTPPGEDPADGGVPPPPPPADPPTDPECSCAPSETRYCEPIRVECADAASDCPDGWSCENIADAPPCASPEPAPEPGGEPADGGAPLPPECGTPPAPENVCLPPYWSAGWGAARDGSRTAVDEATGSEGGRPMGPAPAPMPPVLAPEDPGADPGTAGASGGGGGCSAAPGATGTGATMLGGLMVALWAATRRRRGAR